MKHAPVSLILYVIALAFLIPASTYAQKQKKDNFGKEFYVAFAENQGGQIQDPNGESENFFALFITSKVGTQGKVEIPALGISQNFTTIPGKVTTIELPDGKTSNAPTVELTFDNGQEEKVVSGMAVHITSNDDIAVYGMNHKRWSSDAFMALPVGVLGTEYRTLNYPTSNPPDGRTPGEFWIVAVADTTNVTITPRAATRIGSPAGTPIKVFMNKGDVYLVQGDPSDGRNDLTGSVIESDQPIAVLSGHVRTAIPWNAKNVSSPSGSRDHLVEQLPPVSAWGDSALIVRYESASKPDLVRVVSSEDGNIITVNGTVVANLNAGDFYEITQLTTPVSIQATSPILVGQYMHTSLYGISNGQNQPYGDPAYSLVFPVEQFDTSYTFMLDQNPTFNGNFINIIADPNAVATMMLDGVPITGKPYNAVFLPIPGSNYVYTQVSFSISQQGAHNIYSLKPFGITVYALGPVDSYSYPGGTLLKTITPFKTVDLVIDFGDRVMQGAPGFPIGAVGYNKWDTTVYLQNISSDPYQINGFSTRTGDITNFAVVYPDAPNLPTTIGPGVIDSIKIEFTTQDPNMRKHSKINALTEHLRAYVVDVFGRGILENAQIFTDSTAKVHIDTLDFGILDANVDLFKDSFVFIFNKGELPLAITGGTITPLNGLTNPTDFSIQATSVLSKPTPLPYTLPGFNNILSVAQDTSIKMVLRFTTIKGEPNGLREAELDITNTGVPQKVILLATIKTILKSPVLNASFDTAYLCQNQTRSIFVNNPNDFPITVTSVNLGGPNQADFSVITLTPLVIPPSSQGEIKLQYAPSVVGTSIAQAVVNFDLPKGYADTLSFSAYGNQFSSSFWARNNIHILPNEQTLFPIYARSPMQNFGSPSFTLTLSYDPSHLIDDPTGLIQVNTLTALGAWDVNNDSLGYSIYSYHTLDGSIVSGGGPDEIMPLVYIMFRSNLNPGDDPVHFHQDVDINYTVTFDKSAIPQGCVLSLAPTGRITVDSTCETVYLLNDTLLYPQDSWIEPVRPNPIYNGHAKFVIDVPQDDIVHLDVIDMLGNKTASVLNEARKPGTYEVEWDASNMNPGMYYVRLQTAGRVKLRKLVIVH